MPEVKYLKIEASVESDGYDGYASPSLNVTELNTELVFPDQKALESYCKSRGWVKNDSSEFKKYLKENGYRFTPISVLEARSGIKVNKLFFQTNLENIPATIVGVHALNYSITSSDVMNKELHKHYGWKDIVKGKVKMYAEVDIESVLTPEELTKLKADRVLMAEKKKLNVEKQKAKKLLKAKKLIENLENDKST